MRRPRCRSQDQATTTDQRPPHEKTGKFEGKVCEVRYDCSGEFEGFVLTGCGESRYLRTRVRRIEEVIAAAMFAPCSVSTDSMNSSRCIMCGPAGGRVCSSALPPLPH